MHSLWFEKGVELNRGRDGKELKVVERRKNFVQGQPFWVFLLLEFWPRIFKTFLKDLAYVLQSMSLIRYSQITHVV